MALMNISDTGLTIEFSGRERTWTRRGSLTVPLAAVRRVTLVDNPLRAAHGARKGLHAAGIAKIGVWGLVVGPRQLVAAYRGRPGLRVELDRAAAGGDFDELVLSLDEAQRAARLIEQRVASNR
ncbi:hypothetical protein OG978_31535 [Streptomyces sp. NBC_01591]|uniref:hypothetical protein n=1 Tax=Streptomyces sp. NBC_01591 TaxID=2975888 RepID=UPI002DDC1FD5|nr:hypothetical protein [Streptomyces sp. NBC_01591]WSD71524.1 hypothetical protein OG978_31535 [Streptomyces sp. NBC_01591]